MLKDISIIIKGAGEMASAIGWRLHRSGFKNLVMLETKTPIAVRRSVCFSEAIYDGKKNIDGVEALLATTSVAIDSILNEGKIAVITDPDWNSIKQRTPQVVIDAIIAKKNLGSNTEEAELVIGLGPGFTAGKNVHVVIETNRGPDCGRVLYSGQPEKNTGIPGSVMGFDVERVLRAPESGKFIASVKIGDTVKKGDVFGMANKSAILCQMDGMVRGQIRNNTLVSKNLKIGDIEPRSGVNIHQVSDKGLCLAGATLEAILARFNI